eukprot:scaffold37572_cov176-Amphora_coffeaeformis.AAC.2
MTRFAILGMIVVSLVTGQSSAHTIRKNRKTIVSDNTDIFYSHTATVLPSSKKSKKTKELKCVVKHKKAPIQTARPTISPAPTSSTRAPSSKGGKGSKGEYCPTIISACSLLEMGQAEFGSFQYVLDLKLAIEDQSEIGDVMLKLEDFLEEELNRELAACVDFDVRRRMQENTIMKLDLDVAQDTTTPCVEATTRGTCVNVDVKMKVTHDEGNTNAIRTSIFQAVRDRCDGIKELEGIVETFDPCPYLSITGGEEGNTDGDSTTNGGGSTTGGGDGTDSGGGATTGGSGTDGNNSGGSGGVTTGGSGAGGGNNTGGSGGVSTGGSGAGGDNNSSGSGGDATGGIGTGDENNTGGTGGDATGGSSSGGGENTGDTGGDTTGGSSSGGGDNTDGTGGDVSGSDGGTGSTGSETDGDGSSTEGGNSGSDGDDEDGGGGIAAIATTRESEEGVQTGGYISISVAAALLLLMLLFVVRRRSVYESAMKHKQFIDEVDECETDTYLKDSDIDSQDQQNRQVHVVGEADSVFSGWSGYTTSRETRRDNGGLHPDQYGGSMDDSFLKQDVHKCASATCELCEQKRRAGIQFVPAKMPGHSSYVATDSPRHYMMEDTVTL